MSDDPSGEESYDADDTNDENGPHEEEHGRVEDTRHTEIDETHVEYDEEGDEEGVEERHIEIEEVDGGEEGRISSYLSDDITRRDALIGGGAAIIGGLVAGGYLAWEDDNGFFQDGPAQPGDGAAGGDGAAAPPATEQFELCDRGYRIHQSVAEEYNLPIDGPQQLYANEAGQFGLIYEDANGDGAPEWYIGGVGGAESPPSQNRLQERRVENLVLDWMDGRIETGPNGVQTYC